jgi:hypothetical protein
VNANNHAIPGIEELLAALGPVGEVLDPIGERLQGALPSVVHGAIGIDPGGNELRVRDRQRSGYVSPVERLERGSGSFPRSGASSPRYRMRPGVKHPAWTSTWYVAAKAPRERSIALLAE